MLIGDKEFADLVTYWHRLKAAAGADLPRRSQFSVTHIPHLMPYLYLFEVRGWTDLHVLYTGSALDRVITTPMTGRNFLSFYAEAEWPHFGRGTEIACTTPCGCRVFRDLVLDTGECFHTESIALPLADKDDKVRFLIGLFNMELDAHTVSRAPRGLAQSHNLSISFMDLGFGMPAPIRFADLPSL